MGQSGGALQGCSRQCPTPKGPGTNTSLHLETWHVKKKGRPARIQVHSAMFPCEGSVDILHGLYHMPNTGLARTIPHMPLLNVATLFHLAIDVNSGVGSIRDQKWVQRARRSLNINTAVNKHTPKQVRGRPTRSHFPDTSPPASIEKALQPGMSHSFHRPPLL